MFSLKDKVALVTGASQGIGRDTALALAAAGAKVAVAARNQDARLSAVLEGSQPRLEPPWPLEGPGADPLGELVPLPRDPADAVLPGDRQRPGRAASMAA